MQDRSQTRGKNLEKFGEDKCGEVSNEFRDNYDRGYLPARSRTQSFTFLLVDSLPPAIFIPHVSYSRDSPIHRRDIWLSPMVKVQIFEGYGGAGNQLSWPPPREKKNQVSRNLVDLITMIQRRDGWSLRTSRSIYAKITGTCETRAGTNRVAGTSNRWSRNQVFH